MEEDLGSEIIKKVLLNVVIKKTDVLLTRERLSMDVSQSQLKLTSKKPITSQISEAGAKKSVSTSHDSDLFRKWREIFPPTRLPSRNSAMNCESDPCLKPHDATIPVKRPL